MNISAITIENFKGIRDRVRIDLKPVTLLFGPNSAGKSTIIQAIHYAWEILGARNPDPNFTTYGGESVELGGFENIVYGHDKSRSVSIRFDMEHVSLSAYAEPEAVEMIDSQMVSRFRSVLGNITPCRDSSVWSEFQVSWSDVLNAPYISSYSTGINKEPIATIRSSDQGKTEISYINFWHPLFYSRNISLEEEIESYFIGENTRLSDTTYLFLGAIINAFQTPESWAHTSVIPEACFNTITSAIESLKEIKPVVNEIIPLPTDFSGLHRENVRRIRGLISPWAEAIRKFVPLNFWLLCREFFDVKTLDGNVNIECLNRQSVLPKIGERFNLRHNKKKSLSYGLDFEALTATIHNYLAGPCHALTDALRKFRYLGPVRTSIPRNYAPNKFVDERGWANGIAAWDALYKEDDQFVAQVSRWMSERLKCGYRLRRKHYKELDLERTLADSDSPGNIRAELERLPTKTHLSLTDENSGIEVHPPDIGVGITQVLPVIVAVLYKGADMLAIEQPELHIHPALQVSLGDLFIGKIGENGKVFIIETHSEHLMLRFLRRIRETAENEIPQDAPKLRPDQLAVYYAETGESGMRLSQIRIDEDGDFIDRWPKGFFSERVKELYT